MTGRIRYWRQDNKYGFIGRKGHKDVFVHVSEIPHGIIPVAGDTVEFEIIKDEYGREKAVNVAFLF